jgi:hypothetical protein
VYTNEKPPTLLSPASAKAKSSKTEMDSDAASMVSTSTSRSTVSLLKSKLHSHKARKEAKHVDAQDKKKSLPKDPMSRKSSQDWDGEKLIP